MLVANIKRILSFWLLLVLFLSANLAIELNTAEAAAAGSGSSMVFKFV